MPSSLKELVYLGELQNRVGEVRESYPEFYDSMVRAGYLSPEPQLEETVEEEVRVAPDGIKVHSDWSGTQPGLVIADERSERYRCQTENCPDHYNTEIIAKNAEREARHCGTCGAQTEYGSQTSAPRQRAIIEVTEVEITPEQRAGLATGLDDLIQREPTLLHYATALGEEALSKAKIVGQKTLSAGKYAAKGAAHIGITAMYPFLGQLSYRLRSGLEAKLGKNVFDEARAANISMTANIMIYSTLVAGLLVGTGKAKAVAEAGVYAGMFYSLIEAAVRIEYTQRYAGIPASLPGKIVSLPIEFGMYLHKKVKEAGKKIKARAKEKARRGDPFESGGGY